MGQRQSSSSAAEAQAPIQTSYYELLGVERQATDDEIKKAYRRKALELHPDRNYGKEEEATKLFAEIQAAHEVLSDPQERAWYDSHESAILRGGDVGEDHFQGSIRVTTAEDVTAMIGKFNGRVRFDDSPDGFFGFLREAFAKLAKEEEIAADLEGADMPDYPTFGHKDDTHDDVVQDFYRGWASFTTKKSFAWKDMYRLNEAPDRRIKRLMEKENKKLRDEGIREFNDAMRALLAFVRKRDPRYTPNTQSEAERQKALREASAAQAARARAANAAKMDEYVPEWAKARAPEDDVEITDEESEEEHFECVACHKTFKSEKQFEAHEKSKKHQKAVQGLRRKMQKDNARLNLDDDVLSSGIITPQDDDAMEDEEGEDIPEIVKLDIHDDPESEEASAKSEEETAPQRQARQTLDRAKDDSEGHDGSDEEDSDYAPRLKVKSRLNGATVEQSEETAPGAPPPTHDEDDQEALQSVAQKKQGKAAQKRAKKAAKAAEADSEELKFKCARCNAAFPSKTRLFQHIKDNGHAAPAPAGKAKSGKKR
jgi:DnaJ family protein A protein 5